MRRLLLAAGIGLLLAGTAPAAADPGDDDEVPVPGLVNAIATCASGTAAIRVEIDDNRDAPLPVRLDRLSPDTATRTAGTVIDKDTGMHIAVFEPVPVGEYNVHVERAGGARPDDVPAVVRPCTELQPTDEVLRVEVECQAGWGLASFVVANPKTKGVVRYELTNTNFGAHDIALGEGRFLRITETLFDDGSYQATLTENKQVVASKTFTVSCREGNPPRLDTTAACPGTVTVDVLNPNRIPVSYGITLADATKTVTLKGGERGSVAFTGIAEGEHPILVKGGDKTQARSSAKLDCAIQTTTTAPPPTTTETPVPQGRSDAGLANTGAPVSTLAGLTALAFGLGGALLMIGRRRARGNRVPPST